MAFERPTKEIAGGLIGIYSNLDEEFDDALRFLKPALKNNEAILLITDENWDKDSVHKRMNEEWSFSTDEIKEIENEGGLTIVISSNWYFPDSVGRAPNKGWIHRGYSDLVTKSLKKGKSAIRVFVNTSLLFKLGVEKEFLKYEYLVPSKFGLPIIAVCAYQTTDLSTYLTKEEIKALCSCSSLVSMTRQYNIIKNPPTNEHIALLYENEYDRDTLAANYINEGLKRGQLCAYASVMSLDSGTLNNTLGSKIVDFDKHVREGNLMLINLSSHYIGALTGNLKPFEVMERDLIEKAKIRKDKHVRIVADCAGLLFENKHFDECVVLEEWWHHKPFEGSYLCPFPNSLCDKFPYDYHKYRVFGNHDIIIDQHGSLIGSYIPHTSLSASSILHLLVA